jgi:hypothetical protein
MQAGWKWEKASRAYGNFGNANQWTVNAGMASLARESGQNTNDARAKGHDAELVYTFIRLTGDERNAFQAAVDWEGLLPHLEAMAAAAEGSVTAGQIEAGLEAVKTNDELLLLQVADYGCRGLTGPEFPDEGLSTKDYGNFIKLCRLDLFSGKDEAAGGSFGLGKAVYWRFSRLQTVLFNSSLAAADSIGGQSQNRLFGVNQGVRHTAAGGNYEGRGHFGQEVDQGDIASMWADPGLARRLHVERQDSRPGTTALLLAFYDPDSPERGRQGGDELLKVARDLRQGIEESFWPLLTRGRLSAKVRVVDEGEVILDEPVDPEDTYPELVRALRRFDAGDLDEALHEPYSVVTRDLPIKISARKDAHAHPAFEHTAKLVVTSSDAQKDSLENSVCLIRRPEMVVQNIERSFEGQTYHAFVLAGASITPDAPSPQELNADDFLRFAEPPAHDRWIPGTGRHQASQANLTARYTAPWIPNLKNIEKSIHDALFELFGTPPPTDSKGPESVLRHLKFLRGEPGRGGRGSSAPRRPEILLSDWKVEEGRWKLTFEIAARNQRDGWLLEPHLRFVGLDGKGTQVAWESLTVIAGGEAHGRAVRIPEASRGRKVKAVVHGVSTDALPIPAHEAAVDVVIGRVHTTTHERSGGSGNDT